MYKEEKDDDKHGTSLVRKVQTLKGCYISIGIRNPKTVLKLVNFDQEGQQDKCLVRMTSKSSKTMWVHRSLANNVQGVVTSSKKKP